METFLTIGMHACNGRRGEERGQEMGEEGREEKRREEKRREERGGKERMSLWFRV